MKSLEGGGKPRTEATRAELPVKQKRRKTKPNGVGAVEEELTGTEEAHGRWGVGSRGASQAPSCTRVLQRPQKSCRQS